MENITLPNDAKIQWLGDELSKDAIEKAALSLLAICEYVKGRCQQNVSVSSRASGPSNPGEYPHADTGLLRNSLFVSVDEKEMTGIVGTNLKYGLWLEYGTAGGKRITARGKGMLSWIGRDGVRRFAKSVVMGPIRGRSYLRRTFMECLPKLEKMFSGQFGMKPSH